MRMLQVNQTSRLLALAVGLLVTGSATAAELRLRAVSQPQSAIVRLGDVADVLGASEQERQQLSDVELIPLSNESKTISAREIQDLLILRGHDLTMHRLSGASRVEISAVAVDAKSKVSPIVARQTALQVRQAIIRYLERQGSGKQPWDVTLELEASQAQIISEAKRELTITGGSEPWVGMQTFTVLADSPRGLMNVAVKAQVTLPAAVVVAIRPLEAGARIRPADVQLQYDAASSRTAGVLSRVEDAIGQEVRRTIPAGAALQKDHLRSPLMVRRGDLVTVFARTSGICVKTVGKVNEDGSVGDLVEVESLDKQGKYFARVSGSQEVEVFPRATTVAAESTRTALNR